MRRHTGSAKLYLFFVLIHISGIAFAQNEQQTFLSGKQFLNEGKYNFAMESFKRLANPNATHEFKEYSSFYYGLAAYKNGNLGLARSMWLQIESKYPNWNKIGEVYLWLAEVYYQESNAKLGTAYAQKVKSQESAALQYKYLSELNDIAILKEVREDNPEDKMIGSILAQAILKQPLEDRDYKLIQQLSEKFEFGNSFFGLPNIGSSVKKSTYNVAVLLPFMYEGPDNTRRIERNRFVTDIYNGILYAAADLNEEGQIIKIFPYDTRRDRNATAKILSQVELKAMDLIIGPLYPEPSKLTSNFCVENKINMINPISSNSAIIGNNPFSFLFKPSHEVQALAAAQYVIDSLKDRQNNAYVFFDDNKKDSLMAQTYTDQLISEGYNVIHRLRIDSDEERTHRAHKLLTETYESKLTQEEADSIVNITGRIIKEGKIESEKKDEEDSIYFYEERYVIEWDSIGHIYLASSKPLHASTFISAIEIRGDEIPMIGRYDWLGYDMITFDQLERLGVSFVSPDYVSQQTKHFVDFRNKYQKDFKKEPSLNSILGYELMTYTGEMMRKYGNYFQNGALQEGFVKGNILYGVDYKVSNSNQSVPITKFFNSELQLVNDNNDSEK